MLAISPNKPPTQAPKRWGLHLQEALCELRLLMICRSAFDSSKDQENVAEKSFEELKLQHKGQLDEEKKFMARVGDEYAQSNQSLQQLLKMEQSKQAYILALATRALEERDAAIIRLHEARNQEALQHDYNTLNARLEAWKHSNEQERSSLKLRT
jgi:hypothetical protein